jgi:hypothetical protein
MEIERFPWIHLLHEHIGNKFRYYVYNDEFSILKK